MVASIPRRVNRLTRAGHLLSHVEQREAGAETRGAVRAAPLSSIENELSREVSEATVRISYRCPDSGQ